MEKKKRVLLGFSGGVDSTSAALMLRDQGYEVTLSLLDTAGDQTQIERATETAQSIDLPLRVCSVREEFRREVIDYFREGYLRGETPAPCTRCNQQIKWRWLYETAQREGYDHVATGHYVRIHQEGEHHYIRKAVDPTKDQSYYLWSLPQEYLRRAITPMGEWVKKEIKERYGSYVRERESMGVCFLRGVEYGAFLRGEGVQIEPGEVVDREGRVVGRHLGTPLYTIGQKRGLEGDLPAGSVVVGIDARRNQLRVGENKDLYHHTLLVREFTAPNLSRLLLSERLEVKIRGFGVNPEGYARVEWEEGRLKVMLSQPAWALATGQPVVFYEEDLVLGGGILDNYA